MVVSSAGGFVSGARGALGAPYPPDLIIGRGAAGRFRAPSPTQLTQGGESLYRERMLLAQLIPSNKLSLRSQPGFFGGRVTSASVSIFPSILLIPRIKSLFDYFNFYKFYPIIFDQRR